MSNRNVGQTNESVEGETRPVAGNGCRSPCSDSEFEAAPALVAPHCANGGCMSNRNIGQTKTSGEGQTQPVAGGGCRATLLG